MPAKKQTYLGLIWKKFNGSRLNRAGLYLVGFLFLVALFAPFIANDKPYVARLNGVTTYPILTEIFPFKKWVHYPQFIETNFRKLKTGGDDYVLMPPIPYSPTEYDLDIPLTPPNGEHWFGTDEQGRDMFSRLVYGSRISLAVGFVSVSLYVVIGLFLGSLAGFYGGRVDMVISRLIEVMMCFPTFFLILTVLAFVGPSIINIMIVLGLTGWTGIARLVRGEFLKLRNMEYVVGIKACGATPARIIFKHLLPNAIAPVMVSASFGIASAIMVESSLSFLGFGVQPPTPSWGDALSQSRDFMDIAWWLTLYPGLAIFITMTAFNLVGEGVRDAVDPKMEV